MKTSLWRIKQDIDNNHTTVTNSLGTLDTQVQSHAALLVGSSDTLRISNVASAPTTIPDAGVLNFDTTRKVLLVSDGTSVFLATGSLA